MVCLMSEEEVRIVDCYLKKYKITNKALVTRNSIDFYPSEDGRGLSYIV